MRHLQASKDTQSTMYVPSLFDIQTFINNKRILKKNQHTHTYFDQIIQQHPRPFAKCKLTEFHINE